jgi:hypothetical protein
MAKNKTAETDDSVVDFIDRFVDNDRKKAESYELIKLMTKWSGFKPKMWGPSIIGFGSVHYKYASGHEGDMPLIGFSPRKAEFSLYVFHPDEENEKLVKSLGKFKMGKMCIYVKKLADIDLAVLEKLCRNSIAALKRQYGDSVKK